MTTVIDTIQKITKADTFDEAWLALCQGAEKLEVIIGSYGFGFLEQTRVPNIEDPVSERLTEEADAAMGHLSKRILDDDGN